ncbi:NAD-dependent DNA ligase LigA [Mycoplasmopsis gallopavonis]|uniref:DNA ligase n=1 Tax=Mycoplasmopsis gallopavonis TaxID=76629 RepID=A0A449AZJ6_9BACT|nr:NAD-dependent DNA ligase LigA [Mycoplasmopsis gallopavonis]RIV16337.1 NAD-dependent DNA ligase LigA [Mycoplasmopsis gallopavonis]VEU72948.1 DNA ligase (NAD(+)) [Mycoplasmopsis gallopavonis]
MQNKKQKILNQMNDLISKINTWNKEYYNDNNPSVSDQEYDLALAELKQLEQAYPQLIQSDSPTLKIGGFADSKFQKYTHQKPMLSLAKAYNLDDVQKFFENTQKALNKQELAYSLEPKIDGLSISLHYQDGQLIKAVTRGDGVIGEDVTENIYQIHSIPKRINNHNYLEIRGEVFLPKTKFQKLNQELVLSEQKPFANPRNAASGTLRQLDPEIVAKRELDAILYDLVNPELIGLSSQEQVLDFLKKEGFQTNPYSFISGDFDFIFNKINEFKDLKNSFEFDCDGFVIKLNEVENWDKLGSTAKFPKYAIAYKYETEEAISQILAIKTTVGRTGKITYVAELEPISLNQTIVQNATLHNYEFIESMNINIGDDVKVIKSGEIIPKIIALVNKNSQGVLEKVLYCPSCNSLLQEIDENVDQFCLNLDCQEKQIKNLIHFVSRPSFNIITLGESYIRLFFEKGFLSDLYSIFNLKEYSQQILEIRGFKDKKLDNILSSIEKAKEIELAKALFALGIKHIGAQVAELITQKISKLSDLISLNWEELSKIDTIGPKIIESLQEYVSKIPNQELLTKLDQILIYKNSKKILDTKLTNLSFVITGTLSQSRDYFKDKILQNGGKVLSSISKNVDYLLIGENAGSKLEKAQKLEIKIINEDEFLAMIEK